MKCDQDALNLLRHRTIIYMSPLQDMFPNISHWCDGATTVNFLCAGARVAKQLLYENKLRRIMLEKHHFKGIPISIGNDIVFVKGDTTLQSIFHDYIEHSKVKVDAGFVDFLIRCGADPRAYQSRALHSAALRGDSPVVETLLKAGAEIQKTEYNALYAAVHRKHKGVVDVLLKNGANPDHVLSLAACVNDPEIVQMLIKAGADVHHQHDNAIRCAASSGNLEIMKMMLDAGGNVKECDRNRFKFLVHEAYEHPEMVKFLIDNGADLHKGNELALISAAENGCGEDTPRPRSGHPCQK